MQHFVQCYVRSVLITQNYHAYGVAHEDDVDATLIEQTRGGIIVRRERGDLLAALLPSRENLSLRLLARSAAHFRTQAVAESGAAAAVLQSKRRNARAMSATFWSAAVLCRFGFAKTTMCPQSERRCQTVQILQASR